MAYNLPDGYRSYFDEWEKKIGSFIEFCPEKASDRAENPAHDRSHDACEAPEEVARKIRGLPFGVKDCIAVKDMSLSCGSKLLQNLKSPYSATVVRKLQNAGALPVGKTNLDEFAMGGSCDNSGIQRTNNPWDPSRVAGGSSGGSAAAVAAGLVPFALGTDTGGSVRQPAAFCGVLGLKPTYGACSRYGLVAFASSLEGVGIFADSVERCRQVFACVRGGDPMDQTSMDAPAAAPPLYGAPRAKTIGVLSPEAVAAAVAGAFGSIGAAATEGGGGSELLEAAAQAATLESEVARGFEKAKQGLKDLGYTLVDVDIPSLKYGVPAYYTICTAEASANLARFDGIRYGKRPDWAENPDDLVDKTRDAGFGPEVKLRILLGTFVLRSGFQDRYYLRAQRIRAGIRASFEALLGDAAYQSPAKVDAILLPVFPTRAFGRGDASLSPFAEKAADLYTCCANLAGIPGLSFPASVEGGLPVGVQLLGRAFSEATLLDIAEGFLKQHPLAHPAGYRPFWSEG